MKYSELEKKLRKGGCYFLRNGKRHPIWESPITGKKFELSHHPSEEVKNGTLKSIIRDSGVKI
jgi:mRNA interferase HicA